MPTSVSAATNTLNFQSKIVNLTDGTNIDTGTPACVVAGNSNDTCDFQVNIYDDPSAGNLLFSEDHVNTEIGQYNGIFNLEINSICNVVSATGTDGNWTDAGDPCISNGGVDFSAADLWIEIGFDPAGGSSFTETFSRVEIRDVASARYAVSASNINGLSSGDFVQFRPGATQTTTSTNTLINLETTANTANPLININENGAGTPDLLRLQNTSSTVFQVANGGFTGIGAGVVTSTFLNLGTSTTGVSALRINDSGGVDVAAPVEGDLWYNGTNLYFNNGILNVDLLGAFTAFIQNGNSYSALAVLGTNDDFSLAFETNGVEKMRLGTDGTLGIATTAATSQVHIVTGGAGSTSGATTMSATSGTSTFTTTATVTLNVGDYIVPNLQSTQSRVVTVGGTGTSFTVSPAYTANVTARTFIIHRKGVTVDGARPLMALRNTLLGTQEWQLRVGALAPGSASFDLYSQTTSQTALRVENDGDVLLGTDTNFGGLGNNSRLYVYGGDGGANIDVMGNAAQVDQATVELQSSDYSTTSASSRLQTYGVSGIGTTFGFANQYLGILAFQEMDTALIATNNTTDLTFITNAVVRATIDGTTGDLILTNDVAVNGGDVTTSAATFNLANTGATTVNAFGAATTVNAGIAGASGTMNLMGGSASTGCTINGTTGDLTCTGTISGSTSPFVQNGNSFGAGAVLGTNDTFNLTFETDGVSRLILDTNGHLTPNVDDTYDLGSTTNRFRDLYLGPATLNIGTSGDDYDISFDTAGVGSLVFNEAGEDDDLRIEGDTNANLFYVDASTDRIGIGTNAPAALFSVGPASEFQVAATGNVTTAGDAAINGGDLTTTAGTFNLVNAGATTLNIGGAATTVTLGVSGASGTLTLMGGNASTGCTINGTTGDLTCTGTINGSSAGFVQNGNSFGAAAILGTNDANSLSFETGGTTQATLSTAGDLTLNNDLAVNGGDLTTTATTFNLLAEIELMFQ